MSVSPVFSGAQFFGKGKQVEILHSTSYKFFSYRTCRRIKLHSQNALLKAFEIFWRLTRGGLLSFFWQLKLCWVMVLEKMNCHRSVCWQFNTIRPWISFSFIVLDYGLKMNNYILSSLVIQNITYKRRSRTAKIFVAEGWRRLIEHVTNRF